MKPLSRNSSLLHFVSDLIGRSSLFLLLSLQLALAPIAHAESALSSDELEKGIAFLYTLSENSTQGADILTDADRDELTEALAEGIATLKPAAYNDFLAHLSVDYRQNPEHRATLEAIIAAIYGKVEPELREDREWHPVIDIIDGTFAVWGAVYVFGFGKGIWKTRAMGLKNLKSFRQVVSRVSTIRQQIPTGWRNNLKMVGAGTALGGAHAVYHYLETQKLDPLHVLRNAQKEILLGIQDLEVTKGLDAKIVAIRDELKNLPMEEVRSQPKQYAERIEELATEVSQIRSEMQHLYHAAPELRPAMVPIAQDIDLSDKILRRIHLAWSTSELGDPFAEAEPEADTETESKESPILNIP